MNSNERSGTVILVESSSTHNVTKITTTHLSNDRWIPKMGLIAQYGCHYYSLLAPIDCFGEIVCALLLEQLEPCQIDMDEKILLLKLHAKDECESKWFHVESLVKLTNKLKNWKITINYLPEREGFIMSRGEIFIECPQFGGEQNPWGDKARRDYAHSFDSTIIKFLDNPAINSVFKHLIEIIADSTWGSIVASGIEINDHNYPELNKLVNECVDTLNIHRPYIIISSALSGLNAITFGSDDEPYIALSPLVVQTMNPTQLKFVIGHECGHVAMGHMVYHTVISIASVFASALPIIGPVINTVGTLPLMAWSRRAEISADRAGLLCCGDLEVAQRTLIQTGMPFMNASQIDISEYVANSERFLKDGVLRKISEFDDAHPIIPKRIKALEAFVNSEKYYRITSKKTSDNLLSDHELENKIESIIKVL